MIRNRRIASRKVHAWVVRSRLCAQNDVIASPDAHPMPVLQQPVRQRDTRFDQFRCPGPTSAIAVSGYRDTGPLT